MSHYRYQYQQQWYLPSGTACATPGVSQCPKPCVVTGASEPCAATGAVLSSPRCAGTRIMEEHGTSCTLLAEARDTRCTVPCSHHCPQLHVPGWEQPVVTQCVRKGLSPCTGGCATASAGQHCSYPYSYQWSKSYSYGCGPC